MLCADELRLIWVAFIPLNAMEENGALAFHFATIAGVRMHVRRLARHARRAGQCQEPPSARPLAWRMEFLRVNRYGSRVCPPR